ncbi:CheY-like chemotaxis protein [Litorivivens lipolytica]|uniref:CheY-like chemotaxis protein n=1 Tax=Litorivivens lipolytica TaxID=1524264 RepID=A0A7W4W789_9GAMM|nr:response regulator [Litorivivens lipolytica]MBB3048209.1 CheY-like chemotaxis protein [Litorivivens lipolytica]
MALIEPLNIVLVEDSYEDAVLISHMIKKLNSEHTVEHIGKVDDAIECLKKPFDLCLLDYTLGAYTGIDVLRALSGAPLQGPIALLTGNRNPRLRRDAIANGACSTLSKDYLTLDELAACIVESRDSFSCPSRKLAQSNPR